jgi:hypothetical protein
MIKTLAIVCLIGTACHPALAQRSDDYDGGFVYRAQPRSLEDVSNDQLARARQADGRGYFAPPMDAPRSTHCRPFYGTMVCN